MNSTVDFSRITTAIGLTFLVLGSIPLLPLLIQKIIRRHREKKNP